MRITYTERTTRQNSQGKQERLTILTRWNVRLSAKGIDQDVSYTLGMSKINKCRNSGQCCNR